MHKSTQFVFHTFYSVDWYSGLRELRHFQKKPPQTIPKTPIIISTTFYINRFHKHHIASIHFYS